MNHIISEQTINNVNSTLAEYCHVTYVAAAARNHSHAVILALMEKNELFRKIIA